MPVNAKLLLGWMEETEAMHCLLREYRGQTPFTEESAKALWNKYRENVAALKARPCTPPVCIAERKQNEQYEESCFVQKFSKDRNILRVVKLDDPSKLVVYQLCVVVPQSERYLSQMQDARKRVRTALGRGLEFTGNHPQPRREGNCLIKPVPHAEFIVTTADEYDFALKEPNRHISVKEFDGRMLLWAGYHRAHISIYRNAPEDLVLPLFAVVESDADGFFSTGSNFPFKRDMVRGSCPPLLGDFFDKSLCIELPLRKCRVEISVNLKTHEWDRLWVDDI